MYRAAEAFKVREMATFHQRLGSGAFGSVEVVVAKKTNGQTHLMARKSIPQRESYDNEKKVRTK